MVMEILVPGVIWSLATVIPNIDVAISTFTSLTFFFLALNFGDDFVGNVGRDFFVVGRFHVG